MGKTYRVLVVDDYEPWRSFATKTLKQNPELQVVGEASDGLEVVQKAQELQPDLILLDIGLPNLNGIAAARRILQYAPKTRILFFSEQSSSDVVEEALRTGARGYVIKSKAACELGPAVEAVLRGKQFVSPDLSNSAFGDHENERTAHERPGHKAALTPRSHVEAPRHHEVGFYSNDRQLLDHVTLFIGAALKNGNPVIVVATEAHRSKLTERLQAYGVDIAEENEQGRYLAFDANDVLSRFLVDGMFDPSLYMKTFENLILAAAEGTRHPRVTVFGECVQLLCVQGNREAVIQVEELCNQLIRTYDVDILCGYSLGVVRGAIVEHMFQQICAQHSTVHSH